MEDVVGDISKKIGFCGPGGSGKSAVLKPVAEALGLPILESVARSVFKSWGIVEEDQRNMSGADLWRLQREIFDLRLRTESEYPAGFISDRTMIDHLGYTLYRSAPYIPANELRHYTELARYNAGSYHRIFYFGVPLHVVQQDGLRELNHGYTFVMDVIMRGIISNFEDRLRPVKVHYVRKSLIVERIAEIVEATRNGG